MPSSGVSDGVQSAITERRPEAIFCAVETGGDGAVNFYSRVHMFLFKAKQRASEEYKAALKAHGVTQEELREFAKRTRWNSPFFVPPHVGAGTGANFVHHIAPLLHASRLGRAKVHARRFGATARGYRTRS